MLTLTIIITLVHSVFGEVDPRIVNGHNAEEGEFLFAVSIRDKNHNHFCGGTILDENHVLTAAHCLCDKIKHELPYSIQYGSVNISSDDTRSIGIANFSCNAAFNSSSMTSDVAVIQLQSAIPKGSWTAVELGKDFSPSLFTQGTIIGWGMLWDGGAVSHTLQKLNVNVLLDSYCGLRFDTTNHICISSFLAGACNGDSGSALLVNGVQVGIASFITTNCEGATALSPNVYARIPPYLDWIEAFMH